MATAPQASTGMLPVTMVSLGRAIHEAAFIAAKSTWPKRMATM